MARLTLVVLLPGLLLAACASAEVPRGTTPVLRPAEALFALVVDAPTHVLEVRFCAEARPTECFSGADFELGGALRLLRVPAGRHCLARIHTAYSVLERPRQELCVVLPAGVVTYPGHLVLREHGGVGMWTNVSLGWERRPADLRRRLDAAYPGLLQGDAPAPGAGGEEVR